MTTAAFIETTLTSRRPGGKGKGSSNLKHDKLFPRTTRHRAPSPSRTEELCPEDWCGSDKDAMEELDEIIRRMGVDEETSTPLIALDSEPSSC